MLSTLLCAEALRENSFNFCLDIIPVSKKGNWENACGTAGESLISSQAGVPSTKTTTRWSLEAGRSLLL